MVPVLDAVDETAPVIDPVETAFADVEVRTADHFADQSTPETVRKVGIL